MEQGWGGMKTHPPSLLSPSREFKWMGRDAQVPFIPSPTDPQCEQCGTMYGHNATIVNSHCRLPLCRDRQQRAMATLPVDSDFVVAAAYPALFGLLGTSIEKIETNEMRNDFTKLYRAKPFTFDGDGDGSCSDGGGRCEPGVISQLSGHAWPNLPWWGAARAALTHPPTLPTSIPITLPIFMTISYICHQLHSNLYRRELCPTFGTRVFQFQGT